jgi:hypothetical protein
MIDRRLLCFGLAGLGLNRPFSAAAQPAQMSRPNAYQFSFEGISGTPIHIRDFKSQAILVVNTACQCGYAPVRRASALVEPFPCARFYNYRRAIE